MDAHRGSGADATIALYRSRASRCDTVSPSRIPAGWCASFVEKPDWSRVVTDLVNTGIYVLSARDGACARRYGVRLRQAAFPAAP